MQAASSESSLVDSFPYSSYIQTNYIPSEEEIVEIKAFLAGPLEQLKDIEVNVDRLEADLQAAKQDYKRLHSQIDACSSLASLPRRLPEDVLREIFLQSMPTDGNAILGAKQPPLIFTKICHRWRQVALSTPAIWKSVHIPIIREEIEEQSSTGSSPITVDQALQRTIGRADTVSWWLERSGVYPIYISLFTQEPDVFTYPSLDIPRVFFDTYAKSLKPFAARWKSLSLSGRYSSYSDMSSISEVEVPSLESVFLNLHRGKSPVLPEDLVSLWNGSGLLCTSSLRKLCIRDLTLDPTQLKVQWRLLTHLMLGAPSHESFDPWISFEHNPLVTISTVLKDCVALICCRLYLPPTELPNQTSGSISSIYLPSLQHLTLHDESANSLLLVKKLETPYLEEIDFCSPSEEAEATITELLARANGNLLKFTVEAEHFSNTAFLDCLWKNPNLRSLSVKQIANRPIPQFHVDDEMLNQLINQEEPILCPRLEEFTCYFKAGFTFDGFINFIKEKQNSRNSKVAKLKRVYIFAISEFNPITGRVENKLMRRKLQAYIEDGMSFDEQTFILHNSSEPREYFDAASGRSSEQYDMWD